MAPGRRGAPEDFREPSDVVVEHLLNYMRQRRLGVGEAVPSESVLCRRLGVSPEVVREAFRYLATAGVLDLSEGRAPHVGRLSDQVVSGLLYRALNRPRVSSTAILDVRRAVEVRAAELAAASRSDADAEALRFEAGTMMASYRQRERFVDADVRFHDVLSRSSGNPLFALAISALHDALAMTIRSGFDSRRSEPDIVRVAEIHVEIADAVATRSVTRARVAMETHFQEAAAYLAGRAVASRARRKAK